MGVEWLENSPNSVKNGLEKSHIRRGMADYENGVYSREKEDNLPVYMAAFL